jgi:hypothetical protein
MADENRQCGRKQFRNRLTAKRSDNAISFVLAKRLVMLYRVVQENVKDAACVLA